MTIKFNGESKKQVEIFRKYLNLFIEEIKAGKKPEVAINNALEKLRIK